MAECPYKDTQWTFARHTTPDYAMYCPPHDFSVQVENFFRPHINLARLNHTYNFSFLSLAPVEFMRFLINPKLANIYYTYILEECEEFLVRDRILLLNAQQFYVKSRLEINGFQLNYKGLKSDRMWCPVSKKIDVPYYERRLTRFPPQYLLAKPFLYQDFECIKKLLRYNIPRAFEAGELHFYTREVMQCLK